jgi:hypothetical protein
MTLTEIQQTEWYKERPQIIKDLIDQYPPAATVRIKATGQIAYIYSWSEDGTMTIGIYMKDNPGMVCDRAVFGYEPDDLVFIQENPDLLL